MARKATEKKVSDTSALTASGTFMRLSAKPVASSAVSTSSSTAGA